MAERKIASVTYRVQEIYAKRALILFARLGKVMGPAMPDLVSAIGGGSSANDAAATALSRVMKDMDPEAFADLVEELVETAEVQGETGYEAVIFNVHLNGKLDIAVKIVGFVLQVHFGPFFSALVADTKAAQAKAV